MPILIHPKQGSILRCDYSQGFLPPEMVKIRPVIVISPRVENHREGLCTVVALSTSRPSHVMPYHREITLNSPLPKPYDKHRTMWVKGDMINTVGFHRLDLLRFERSYQGTRSYYLSTLTDKQLIDVYGCVLRALSLSNLTKHLK